jgi:hypothetical protein
MRDWHVGIRWQLGLCRCGIGLLRVRSYHDTEDGNEENLPHCGRRYLHGNTDDDDHHEPMPDCERGSAMPRLEGRGRTALTAAALKTDEVAFVAQGCAHSFRGSSLRVSCAPGYWIAARQPPAVC